MGTYYKYAERSADSTINWAEVGKNMTDMLQEETRIREEKKSAIDKSTRELGETLANAPMGDFKPVNCRYSTGIEADAGQTATLRNVEAKGLCYNASES